uniref:Secreted protein n=1 Tax=Arundo donax TaxID=35708 RepID=A0A0A9C4X8_ARUDO
MHVSWNTGASLILGNLWNTLFWLCTAKGPKSGTVGTTDCTAALPLPRARVKQVQKKVPRSIMLLSF